MKFKSFIACTGIAGALFFSPGARADDWGCEVLLCLSNPAGPMAVSQCVPPITRLYAAIFKPNPDPFPTCAMARGPNGERNEATPQYNDYYDPCPEGTKPLGPGAYAVKSSDVTVSGRRFGGTRVNLSAVRTGIGEGSGGVADGDGGTSFPQKVCVAGQTGSVGVEFSSGGDYSDVRSVGIYERIEMLPAHRNGFAIKVYVNNKLHLVVRPKL